MSDDLKLSGPIKIEQTTREEVALKLMLKIIGHESRYKAESGDRKYWLTLYRQCWKATSGYHLESILKED